MIFRIFEKYNLSVDLEKQKALVFRQADVEGIVFTFRNKARDSRYTEITIYIFDQLSVPPIGKGSILYLPQARLREQCWG